MDNYIRKNLRLGTQSENHWQYYSANAGCMKYGGTGTLVKQGNIVDTKYIGIG